MKAEKFIAIRRDDRFSPNSVDKDRDILRSSCHELEQVCGLAEEIRMIDEAEFAKRPVKADCYLTMARSEKALQMLEKLEAEGATVVNCARGVEHCQRSFLDQLMRENHIPMPTIEGAKGFWLKRGDAAAQSSRDVVYCPDLDALEEAKADFLARGIDDMVVSAHVPGDLIKFYGVGKRFFRYFYPSDDGISKFGDEALNGRAHHFAFSEEALLADVVKLATLAGVDVYGGDAIVSEDGSYVIIDFNDWPSFSRCKDDAARAIALEISSKLRQA